MSREVTCIFIGAFALLLLCTLGRLAEGQAEYESFLAALQGRGRRWIAGRADLCRAQHDSWFNVTPKAMPVQIGEEFPAWQVSSSSRTTPCGSLVSLAVLFFAGAF
jgi:fumarate reductase subunit C